MREFFGLFLLLNLLALNNEKMGKIRVKFFRKWLIVASQTSLFLRTKEIFDEKLCWKARHTKQQNFKSTIRLCIFSAFDQSLTPWFFFHTGNGFLWFFKQKTGDFFSEKSFSASKGINGCDKWLRFHAQKKLIPKKIHLPHSSTVWPRKKRGFFVLLHHSSLMDQFRQKVHTELRQHFDFLGFCLWFFSILKIFLQIFFIGFFIISFV